MTHVPATSPISDVLALWGSSGWLTPPLNPVVAPVAPVLGLATTVQFAVGPDGPGLKALYEVLSSDLSGRVVVLAGAAGVGGAVWGEILATAARDVGAIGVLVDGAVRDVSALDSIALPTYARERLVVGPAGRAHVVSVGEMVHIGDVDVHAGDTVVLDDAGCVHLAADRRDEVLAAATDYEAGEAEVLCALAAGERIATAYRYKAAAVAALRR